MALRGALPGHCLYRATFQILAKRRDAFARVCPPPPAPFGADACTVIVSMFMPAARRVPTPPPPAAAF